MAKLTPKQQEEVKKDFREWSGGYPAHHECKTVADPGAKVYRLDEPDHEDLLGYPRLDVPPMSLLDEIDRCPPALVEAVEDMMGFELYLGCTKS